MTYQNHKAKAVVISLISYALFLLLLFFMTIEYTPEEEFLAIGVDLNYGVDLVGYGNNQTLNKANDSPITEEMAPSGDIESKSTTSTKPVQPEKSQPKNTERTQKTVAKKVISSDIEKTSVPSSKTTSSTSAKSSPSKTTERVEAPKPATPQRTVDNSSIFKKRGSSSSSNGTVGSKDGIGGNNNGDGKPGDVGDQGSPEGSLDGKSLYGKPGSGGSGGASVSISGWRKKSINLPTDKSNETGKIVFEVSVNDLGTLTQIRTIQSSVSPSVVKFYEDYLKRNLSSYLIPEGTPPSNSNGRITIIIKSGN